MGGSMSSSNTLGDTCFTPQELRLLGQTYYREGQIEAEPGFNAFTPIYLLQEGITPDNINAVNKAREEMDWKITSLAGSGYYKNMGPGSIPTFELPRILDTGEVEWREPRLVELTIMDRTGNTRKETNSEKLLSYHLTGDAKRELFLEEPVLAGKEQEK